MITLLINYNYNYNNYYICERYLLLRELQEWPPGESGGVLQDAPGFDSPAQSVQAAQGVDLWEGWAWQQV